MRNRSDLLLMAGGVATFLVGAIHLQQYADFIKDVPTIGTLFLLNSFAAGLICLMLATRLRTLAALGGIAVSAGALVSSPSHASLRAASSTTSNRPSEDRWPSPLRRRSSPSSASPRTWRFVLDRQPQAKRRRRNRVDRREVAG